MAGVSAVSSDGSLNASQIMKSSGLDRTAFLRLLVTELTYQDPMAPLENKEFIAQLAQFSSLEAMENIAHGFGTLARVSNWTYAVSLIGKEIVGVGPDGEDVEGLVVSAGIEDGKVTVNLDQGVSVAVSTIKEVRG